MSDYNLSFIINSNSLVKNIIYYEKTDSTNDMAKKILDNEKTLKNNFLVLSNYQTKGRGKGNLRFLSPAGLGIYMSLVILKPQCDLTLISMVTALAICKSIKYFVNADVKIKWPNDILINGKKACGILIEGAVYPKEVNVSHVIIGIGINVKNDSFDSQIEGIATSLKKESGQSVDRNSVIIKILKEFKYLFWKDAKDIFKEYLMNIRKNDISNIYKCQRFIDCL